MKIKSLVAVAAMLLSASSAFAVTQVVNLTQNPKNASQYTGGFTVTHTDTFTDTFTFTPTLPSSLVSASLISIGFIDVENINFTSVSLNGHALTITNGAFDTAVTLSQLHLTGPLTLVVSGKAAVAGTTDLNASYSGTFNMKAVPEPETYAMMLGGLGLVGFIGRRRKAANQA